MLLQIVLDATGDSRHRFDPEHSEQLTAAEQTFQRLAGRAYSAFDKETGRRLRSFDRNVTETDLPKFLGPRLA